MTEQAHTANKGLPTRARQIAATAVPVACTDVGIYKAFMPSALSDGVVIARADLAWLLSAIPPAECPGTKFPDGTHCGEYGWHAPNCPTRVIASTESRASGGI